MLWVIMATALAVFAPVAANGFPFLFVDSSDYVILTPRLYRSPFYQIFVAATGWKYNLWFVIVVQALIVGYLVAIALRVEHVERRHAVLAALIVALLSSASIFVGFAMPDIFTGTMFLALYVLMFRFDRLSPVERLLVAALACLSIAVHLSHLVMAAGMIGLAIVMRRWGLGRGPRSGIYASVSAAGGAALAILAYNAAIFGAWSLGPAGSSFLLANLIEYGPARAELARSCPSSGYRLCGHIDRIPRTANLFLWHPGPFRELGGFDGMRAESAAIVAATLRNQAPMVAKLALQNFGSALIAVDASADIKPLSGAGPDTFERIMALVGDVYGSTAQASARNSMQSQGTWPVRTVNAAQLAGLLAALGALLCVLVRHRAVRTSLMPMVIFVVAAFLGNALLCSVVSGVHDRYQGRLTWLFVLLAVIAVCRSRRASPVGT
jgi:hypothetical protein